MKEYVRELNSLESRRGSEELDVNNVMHWFHNTRAAVKRSNQKNLSLRSVSSSMTMRNGQTFNE